MIFKECTQGTEEWGELRKGRPTGSNASRIITPAKGDLSKSREDYALELLAAQMMPANYWVEPDYQSPAMAHGTNTEREARAFFELETGLAVREIGFVLSDCERYGCSPDGLIGDDEFLELKCPQPKTQLRYLLDGELPNEYKPQVHWGLAMGFNGCHFLSYCQGLHPFYVRVTSDDYTEKVKAARTVFLAELDVMKERLAAYTSKRCVMPVDQATNAF